MDMERYVINPSTENSNDSLINDDVQWNQAGYVCLILAYSLIVVFSFFGNTGVLFLFAWDHSLRSPTNLFIISITLSDWFMTVGATPLSMASAIAKKWLFSYPVCRWYAFTTTSLGLVSLLSHGAIALDRYFVIAKPDLGIKINKQAAGVIISGTWIWAFLWAFFPLAGWSGYTYEGLGTWCSVIWQSEDGDRRIMAYVLCLFFVTYIMTMLCLLFCYSSIFRAMQHVKHNLRSHVTHEEIRRRRNFRREKRVLRVVFCIAVTFFAAWTPYGIVGLWATFGDPKTIPIELITSASMCGKASTALNPWVYTATNRVFRRSLKKLWRRLCGLSEYKTSTDENMSLKTIKGSRSKETEYTDKSRGQPATKTPPPDRSK